ncbi:MAG: UDP-N-acetylmuramoyl-L-alanyl-D-glutamate--2,6-diaminopimelate ligase [Planctomyces sp.]|nr:UDP-N-acetylmuramoyl-L-alanyl-D-glutamate--2,6-diaminopimelate ligase [Planctomyces sp.]
MNSTSMDGMRLSLRESLGAVSFVDCGDLVVSRCVCDSREIQPGDLFVALRGPQHDGHHFLHHAIRAGAAGVLVEQPQSRIRIPQCVVRNTRIAWAQLCMAFERRPSQKLVAAGVTGTNGKTTTTWLLRSILQHAGFQSGLLGTIEYHDGRESWEAGLTTPDAFDLARMMSRMVHAGSSHCVMEISSHALDQYRCHGVKLQTGAITNITQDHFDYHGTAGAYRTAKARIAELIEDSRPLLVGIDDPGCRLALEEIPASQSIVTFGMSDDAVLRATVRERMLDETTVRVRLMGEEIQFTTRLSGDHNVLNCLAAAGMAEQLGIDPAAIAGGLEAVQSVPGRMERVDIGQGFRLIVDYAHTPDGLSHCLRSVKSMTAGRLICVFGAGGDRDRSKRPEMARASQIADIVIVTSDNPRSEDPQRIISDILAGFENPDQVFRTTDRFAAIRRAVTMAEPGDSVVIAGRGHESIQQVGQRQISFDDRKVARRALLDLSTSKPNVLRQNLSAGVAQPIPA